MRVSHTQHGVALITALLVVSLASILAASLVQHLHYDTRRTENLLRLDQAELYNNNTVQFARSLLRLDITVNNQYDTLAEYSENNEQFFPVTGGAVAAKMLDQQGCFNLNNLSATNTTLPVQRARFARLLGQLEVDSNLHEALVDSLIDWLDANDITEPQGAEFDYYIGLDKPYRTANGLMASPSELRLVKGYTEDILEKIRPYICALPVTNSAININTASAEMLESIAGLAGQGAQIIADRDGAADNTEDDAPFTTINEFEVYARDKLQLQNFNAQGLQVYSEYFMMESHTNLGAGDIRLYSLIYRNQSDGSSEIIYQSRGTL